jgi:hypothetical protein
MNYTSIRHIQLDGDLNSAKYNLKYLKNILFYIDSINSDLNYTKHYYLLINENPKQYIKATKFGNDLVIYSYSEPIIKPVVSGEQIPLFTITFTVTGYANHNFTIGFLNKDDFIRFIEEKDLNALNVINHTIETKVTSGNLPENVDFLINLFGSEYEFKRKPVTCFTTENLIVTSVRIPSLNSEISDKYKLRIIDLHSKIIQEFDNLEGELLSVDVIRESVNYYEYNIILYNKSPISNLENLSGIIPFSENLIIIKYSAELKYDLMTNSYKVKQINIKQIKDKQVTTPQFSWNFISLPFNKKEIISEPNIHNVYADHAYYIDTTKEDKFVNLHKFYKNKTTLVSSLIEGSNQQFEKLNLEIKIPCGRRGWWRADIIDNLKINTCIELPEPPYWVHGETKSKCYLFSTNVRRTFWLQYKDASTNYEWRYYWSISWDWIVGVEQIINKSYNPPLCIDIDEETGLPLIPVEVYIFNGTSVELTTIYVKGNSDFKTDYVYQYDSEQDRTYRGWSQGSVLANIQIYNPKDILHHDFQITTYVESFSNNISDKLTCNNTFRNYFSHEDETNLDKYDKANNIHEEWAYPFSSLPQSSLYFPELQKFTPIFWDEYGAYRYGKMIFPIEEFTFDERYHDKNDWTIEAQFNSEVYPYYIDFQTYVERGRGNYKHIVHLPCKIDIIIGESNYEDSAPITYCNNFSREYLSEIFIDRHLTIKKNKKIYKLPFWALQSIFTNNHTYIFLWFYKHLEGKDITNFLMNKINKVIEQKIILAKELKIYYSKNMDKYLKPLENWQITKIEPSFSIKDLEVYND